MGPVESSLMSAVSALPTGKEHDALVEGCRQLARRIDLALTLGCSECGGPMGFNDKLWREYRMLLKDLREAVSGGGPDAISELLAELRTEV